MINWLRRVLNDQLATLMQPEGFGVGDGAAVGLVVGTGVGSGVGVTIGVGVAVGVASGVGIGVSDTTMVGIGVAANAGPAVTFPDVIESRSTPKTVVTATPLAIVRTNRH